MRLLALDVGNEADAAGVLLKAGIVEAFGGGTPRMQFAVGRFRVRGRRQHLCHDVFALEFRTAHVTSSRPVKASQSSAHLERSAAPRKKSGFTARPKNE